jgi:CHAT domain-containing protein
VTAVSSLPLDQYRIIDFATHGLVAGEVGGLSEPALVLSIPDRPTAEDDGLLTASRIAKLRLDADWAVLSACNTAAGDTPGAEGLSGLARAFFYAGARSLMVSHWPVESAAAVKLTTGAFSELRKNPAIGRAEALRRSMRALIADRSSQNNADPSVWAPFVLVGEGG